MSSYYEKKSKDHTKEYWIIGIIIALVVAALLIWHSGLFQKNMTAAAVGDQKVSVAEMDYYYYMTANNTISTANMYAEYGISSGYDPKLSPQEQIYDKDKGTTYADYFRQTAMTNLQEVYLLTEQAKTANYQMSEKGKAEIESNLSQLAMYSVQNGYGESAYLKLLYGPYMDKNLFVRLLGDTILASEYATQRAEEFHYTDDELNAYYKEHSAELDTYNYRFCNINAKTEPKTDAEGNTVEATPEETAAALAVAEQNANAMVARLKQGASFNSVAKEFAAEQEKESFNDAEYNHKTESLGSELSAAPYGAWLMEPGRKANEVASVQNAESGYCVVQYIGRTQRNDTYATMDIRNILIKAETDPTTATEEKPATSTQAQLDTARKAADDLLAQWKAGDATAESFAELAKTNSKDTNAAEGGIMTKVARNTMSAACNNWIFTTGRALKSAEVVESTDASGAVNGYQILYLENNGLPRWKAGANDALASKAYEDWFTALKDAAPVVEWTGTKYVGRT
ncbi:MAG: peptidylprolyl isomerase [Evtepia sp.]